ncbi:MAG: DUF5104 domain-containing protein [Anaeroplasmataceae bacterium]
MRKILVILFMVLSISLTSCFDLSDENYMDDHEYCDMLMENLTTYLAEEKTEELKKMFAPKLYSISTFDEDLQALIDYYNGKCESIIGRVTTGEYSNWDYEEKHHGLEYTVITNVDTFRFRIFLYEKDSRSKDNVGITRLYVLKLSEDEYPDERYVGALISEDGIHVAYPHELPED